MANMGHLRGLEGAHIMAKVKQGWGHKEARLDTGRDQEVKLRYGSQEIQVSEWYTACSL